MGVPRTVIVNFEMRRSEFTLQNLADTVGAGGVVVHVKIFRSEESILASHAARCPYQTPCSVNPPDIGPSTPILMHPTDAVTTPVAANRQDIARPKAATH
ncbi:hypothetical protein GWA01_12190 [Gluconobacter wancherniae NBRC 103581]|uniref:Uncharacterized protein n=1 Tax=Gluconobacter wancherniae NBRC 103581 TaxID=656744 RepID=A0A511AZ14_9PROT|nr:hypothetical protein GWA01_12190 [Gluconobacter wancherniae NBRC 103581]